MATSGVSNWNPVLVDIIYQALLNATAVGEDEDVAYSLYQTALTQLNGLVKGVEATGAHVWTEAEAVMFLDVGVGRYVIGGDTPTARTSDAFDWTEAVIAQAAAAPATAVVVASAAGLAMGQNFGVIDDANTTEWFTIASIVGTTVHLSGPLAANVSAGAFALAYTDAITRPLKVPFARNLQLNGLIETPMTRLSRKGYMDLPKKTAPGVPTQFFYSPQRSFGEFFIWPVPMLPLWAVRFTWYRPLQDFLDPLNTADFPQEWINPLIWNLSKEIAPSYEVSNDTWQRITAMAEQWAMTAQGHDREPEDIQFGYDALERA